MVRLFFVGFLLRVIFGVLDMVLQGLNLGLHFGMRIKKIKVCTLTNKGASPKYIGTMKREDGESFANLRVHPEEKMY